MDESGKKRNYTAEGKNWSTTKEINYIKTVGTRKNINSQDNPTAYGKSRLELLKNYKEGCRRKFYWGQVNKEKIFEFLDAEISREGQII